MADTAEAQAEMPQQEEPKVAEVEEKEEQGKEVEGAEVDDASDDEDDEHDHDHDHDHDHGYDHDHEGHEHGVMDLDDAGGSGKQSRAEKKARKALQKLNLKAVPGVNRVTLKNSKNVLFVISKPDVFKSPNAETYVIFGEAKIEDLSAARQTAAAEKFKKAQPPSQPLATPAKAGEEEEEEDDNVSETGLEEKDIDLVMAQTEAKRSKVVKALKENNGDIVNAIMALSVL
mmetsp:Transcript_3485/g.10543  ORF Transcript_3485/g.10543 Transcript_3485/m.10543 type:complete len:230 (+) Transcript_3485:145-834(+)